jgi:hypothetical protein
MAQMRRCCTRCRRCAAVCDAVRPLFQRVAAFAVADCTVVQWMG